VHLRRSDGLDRVRAPEGSLMRFSAIHKLTSYLMVLVAVVGLLLSPEISFVTGALTLIGIALSWFAEPARFRLERFTAAWNVATVVVFFYLITDVFRGGSVLSAGACFLLFVLINKLFNRRSSKDYQQAYVISFLILVVATTLNTGVSYAFCFALFILFGTWALTLLHLRREMEENYLLKHSDGAQSEKVEVERILNSRRIVGRSFLAGTSLVSVGIIVIAALIFTLFPRIGFGLFLGHKRVGVAMVGFSERVQLGHHGTVRDNPEVVMRVVFPKGRPRGDLRWRGSAFDHYDAGVWSHGEDLIGRTRRVAPRQGLYIMNHAPGLPMRPMPRHVLGLVRQEIYLEPLDSTVIFAADRPVALDVPRPAVGGNPFFIPRRGPLGEIRAAKMRTSGVRYVAYSKIDRPSPSVLRRSPSFGDPFWGRFLQVPSSLPRRIRALARRITRGRETDYDRVVAVRDFLRKNYRYTLKLTHNPRLEPVDEFLFVNRRGHCEYFASAMTLMLRTLGIHARNVNGFAGGEWNRVGKYMAVRQGDAHAWVEVLFANVGWVAFDPTPGGGTAATAAAGSFYTRIRQFWDTLRLRWFRYVVEYDLGKQVSLFQGVGKLLGRSPSGEGWLQQNWRTLLGVFVAVLVLFGLTHWWRHRRRRHDTVGGQIRGGPPATVLYQRVLRALARGGYPKPADLTPREFADHLVLAGFSGATMVERLTGWYYTLRYAGAELTEERLRAFKETLARLQRSIAEETRAKRAG
jgi:transglutaminase-like putative cysteine protease